MSFNYDDIIKDSDPVLRTKSENVSLPLGAEDQSLLMDMLAYVKDSQDEEKAEALHLRPAVGIAAIQLGVPKKMLAIVVPDAQGEQVSYALVNPRIISESVQKSYLKSGEGCLSVEEHHEGLVPRSARITIKGYDVLQGEEIQMKAEGYLAIVLQHEIDHFSGILFYDHINTLTPWFAQEDGIIIE